MEFEFHGIGQRDRLETSPAVPARALQDMDENGRIQKVKALDQLADLSRTCDVIPRPRGRRNSKLRGSNKVRFPTIASARSGFTPS
jgi:hypothetical protein